VLLDEHEGTTRGAAEYERRLRKHRVNQACKRWVLQVHVPEMSGGPGRWASITSHKIPALLRSLDEAGPVHRRSAIAAAVEVLRFIAPIASGLVRDLAAVDFADRHLRKLLRVELASVARRQLRMRLKYQGSRAWSSRVDRTLPSGLIQSVRVNRPCRTSFMPSSESLKLWQFCHELADDKALELIAWSDSRPVAPVSVGPFSPPPAPKGPSRRVAIEATASRGLSEAGLWGSRVPAGV
jgi:hypothetical protein